jgi:hypothetical protein
VTRRLILAIPALSVIVAAGIATASVHGFALSLHARAGRVALTDPDRYLARADRATAAVPLAGLHHFATAISIITNTTSHVCSVMSGQFAYLQHGIDTRRERLLTIVTDPAVTTDADVRAYARSLGSDPSRWTIRRATFADHALAVRMGVTSPGTQTDHVERVAIAGRDGRVTAIVDGLRPDIVDDALAEASGRPRAQSDGATPLCWSDINGAACAR